MRLAILCLSLLLATSAAAASTEEALCGPHLVPVSQMPDKEKLCRAFVRSLSTLPTSTRAELSAVLSPANLATMTALSSVWLGAQGVPVVGEAVDGALLTLGIVLIAAQAGEVSNALWSFANRAVTARSELDLKASAEFLAFAISKVGVTVVTFVLMKKAAGRVAKHRAPPNEPPAATPEGVIATDEPAAVPIPVRVGTEVRSQGIGRPSGGEQASPPKAVDPKAFADWVARARKKPLEDTSAEAAYQLAHAGAAEIELSAGGVTIRADGARTADAHLLEAKHIGSPGNSPYIPGSRCPERIRDMIRQSLVDQFLRYAAILRDPSTPAVGLEVITNDVRALTFFESLMKETNTPGKVVVRP